MAVLAVTKIRVSRRPASLQPLLMRGNDLITLLVAFGARPISTEFLISMFRRASVS